MTKPRILMLVSFFIWTVSFAQVWEQHWIDSNYVFSGSGGDALTVTQTACEEGLVQVTDAVNAPLGAFSPIIANPKNPDGTDLVDISGVPVSITLRVRSIEAVEIGGLFRSGDGSSDFRTDIIYADVPAGLEAWTEITLDFTDALGGFDATDLRDVWLFLDRGEENFSGNELYIDYLSLVGAPMPGLESPCTLDGGAGAFWEQHWIDSNYVFSGSGGDALTITQTACEEGLVEVTDPENTPLGAFNPIIINPQGPDGSDVIDISDGPVSITLRVRSLEAVEIGGLFRSGDGSSDFRTDILYADVPAGLESWTEITLDFTDALGGFDATDLRDVWLFLDRGEENFSGNELYIDYVSLGGPPTAGLESPCDLQPGNPGVFVDYFEGDSLTSINTSSTAGLVTDFILDTLCETLLLRVGDPVNSPLPAFNAYQVDPVDSLGDDITDLSAGVNVTMRVRSAEAVAIDVLFRSGEGTSSERSDRKAFAVPAGLEDWTTFTITFEESEYAGLDPSDIRDMWFYLDRGSENFPGNELYIDHIAIGTLPDSTRQTDCSTTVEPQTWAAHWQEGETVTLGGSETEKLNVSVTECEEVFIEVADPVNAAHQAFRPVVINPADENGVEITNITGNVQVVVRARSAAPLPLGVQLRSGDGSADFRTALQTQIVEGQLDAFTVLTYTFEGDDLNSFVAADFLDLWLFLDRENENFPGNELYLDYIAIGPEPDTTLDSPCGLPDIIVSTAEAPSSEQCRVFPNPVEHVLHWQWAGHAAELAKVRLMNSHGQVIRSTDTQSLQSGSLSMEGLAGGIYYLEIDTGTHRVIRKVVKL
ncbi:MAG: T9SS type A sorting domain-containing protein [Phaeodactylibacter sp.]|uniref:T9SS type A sorting domain-containing protein n=1 Tax=Phaeodactylibacter sp. TaxID=1940289 RepID=UPI0032EF3D55